MYVVIIITTVKKRICSICSNENSEYCSYCYKETLNNLNIYVFDDVKVRDALMLKFRNIKNKIRSIIHSGWKPSGDPKLPEGIYEDRVIDRDKNEYHHITRDVITGKITHCEHERLSEHKPKTNNSLNKGSN